MDKVTAINWIVQAKHGAFHQAMSTTGCAYATDIYKDHSLDVTIKIGGIRVRCGTQLLMTDAVDYGIGVMNAIIQAIPKITIAAIF